MDTYLKVIGIAVIGILLCLILSKNAKDFPIALVIVLCCLISCATLGFIEPVIHLLEDMETLADAGFPWLTILLKATGLTFIGETVCAVCSDSGHAAVGKVVQTLTTVVILWLSLPLIQNLLDLIQSVLEML